MSAMKPTRKDAASSPASSYMDPPVPTGSWPVSDCRRAPPRPAPGAGISPTVRTPGVITVGRPGAERLAGCGLAFSLSAVCDHTLCHCHAHPIAGIAGAVTRPWRCTSSR
jgi:hypothetical protein